MELKRVCKTGNKPTSFGGGPRANSTIKSRIIKITENEHMFVSCFQEVV